MQTKGCDPAAGRPRRAHEPESAPAVKGYGQSFYEINRGYVRSIWFERRPRYHIHGPEMKTIIIQIVLAVLIFAAGFFAGTRTRARSRSI